MKKDYNQKLESIINEFSLFLERDYSSRFKTLSSKEDRQLFFLAKVLVQLKQLSNSYKEDTKVLSFPVFHLQRPFYWIVHYP